MSDPFIDAISSVHATVGVAARHLDTGETIGHNSDEVFFTASTFKVPLLAAMYRKVDRGELDLSKRIEITDDMRVPGSGVLKTLDSGVQPTLRDLATLMIIVSDNTATDLIYEIVGPEELSAMLAAFGLTRTRIPMTTRELLYTIVGLDPHNPVHTYQLASRKLFGEEYDRQGDGFSLAASDVSTPDDMCRLLELIYGNEILSESSRAELIDMLKRQQLNTVLPAKLPGGTECAHKTGSYHGVRCDVGIVYAPGGPYAVAIMAKDVIGVPLETDLALAAVSRAVYDRFNP